jgi:hypothetical protein
MVGKGLTVRQAGLACLFRPSVARNAVETASRWLISLFPTSAATPSIFALQCNDGLEIVHENQMTTIVHRSYIKTIKSKHFLSASHQQQLSHPNIYSTTIDPKPNPNQPQQ